jgi:hypothetical protein
MKQTYRCPRCKRTCTVYVKLSEPPVCSNPNKHRLMPSYMEAVSNSAQKKSDPLNQPD